MQGVAVSYVEQRRVRMEHQQQEEELLEECEMLVMERPGVDALGNVFFFILISLKFDVAVHLS
jgi:hypothetical protein